MIIEKVKWLSSVDSRPVGIVKTYDDIEHKHKYYIGTGRGRTESEDIRLIIEYGQKYYDLNFLKDF